MKKIFTRPLFRERRKGLRNAPTKEEYKLWFRLKNKKLGVKFRRQHSIGPYIIDFYCNERRLVIEIDGSTHKNSKEYDKERTLFLNSLDIKVLRFWNSDISNNLDKVLEKIIAELN